VKMSLLRPNSYAEAKYWYSLEYVLTEALGNTTLDEMILLLHTTIRSPQGWRSKYVRPVFHNRLDEVPKLLLSTTPGALRAGATLPHKHELTVEPTNGVQSNDDHDGQERQKHIDIPEEKIADTKELEVVTSGEEVDKILVNAARTIQGAYRRRLERKRAAAARKIQVAYRRRLKRKNIVRMGIDATQAHYWHILRKESMKMEWAKGSHYYLLFRVALGYVLACLDTIKAFAQLEKNEAKKRVMTEGNKQLEDLMEALDNYRCGNTDCTLSISKV
jgi:hypothetical protein